MARTTIPAKDRFWGRVKKTSGCWIWTGTINDSGYGVLGRGGRDAGNVRAHVLSWTLTNGEIPDGIQVCHHCDNPPCVRPDHLFLGTPKQNANDRDAKNRVQHGMKHYARKVNPAIIRKIFLMRGDGLLQREIAEMLGMSRSGISAICVGRNWKRETRRI